jgi:uncharacterized protein (TIGR02246 family)
MADGFITGFRGPADDIAAIRALNDSYVDAVNRRDSEAWGALWADDATWNLMGTEVAGRAAIVALWSGAMAGFDFVGFFGQLGAVSVAGMQAEGRVWTHELLDGPDGERRPLGRYDDRYTKQNGAWRFERRNFTLRRP